MILCRLDLSNRVGKDTTTAPLPTKMYSVIEIEDEESVEPAKEDDEDEETKRGGMKMEEEKNDEADEKYVDLGKARTEQTRKETTDETNHDKEKITNVKEKIASSEEGIVIVEKNEKTAVTEGKELENVDVDVEKQAGDKLKQIIENENLESEIGKKTVRENEEKQIEKSEEKEEEMKDQMKSKSSESVDSTGKKKDQTRIREESPRTDQLRERDQSLKQSNKSPILVGYVKSTGKPTELSSTTHSVKRTLGLNHSTMQAYPSKKNMSEITTVPSSPKAKSINRTRNRGASTGTLSQTETTKVTWVNKTNKFNNPRLNKVKQPRTKATINPPNVRQSTISPKNAVTSSEEPLTCKIPTFEPFHPHVSRLQHDVGTNLREICRRMYPYTPVFRVVNNKLTLKDDVKYDSIDRNSIEIKEITRVDDENFMYEKARNPFSGLSSIYESNDIGNSDFFRVEYKINGREASDLYARVSPRLDVLESQTKLAKSFQEKGLPLNVLIIGFDSTSRANFVRKLPRVKSFLETKLTTFFMEGMSIVGDATTPVLTAMLTGKDETVLPEGRTSYGG